MRLAAVFRMKQTSAPSALPLDSLPAPAPAGSGLLSGVRILDLTTSIAGPYATMLLADMGAEVIKVERPGRGDDARAWGPPFLDEESLWFLSVNRNKQSITLDYASEAGRAVLHDLVRKVDVVAVNLVERVQRKLGVDHATLAALRADLVHVSITGFGLSGARNDRACYDLIAEGYSGVMDLTGEPDSPPQKVGTPAADLISGMDAAFTVVSALFDRHGSGRGHQIDIAMVDSMTRFMAPRILPYLGSGGVPARTGAKDSVIAVYQAFNTATEPLTLGLGNDGIWTRFWQAVGQPEYATRPAYASNAQRLEHRHHIVKDIQNILIAQPRDHWLALFAPAGIPAGPVNRIDELVNDPELQARGLFYTAAGPGGRRIPQVGLGIGIDGARSTYRSAPPLLGEHTSALLKRLLGYDEQRISELREAHLI
jgi:crotonobetainyl-CoA:carnitine CoA-transferase CaiB-like acyl-CoA transferase